MTGATKSRMAKNMLGKFMRSDEALSLATAATSAAAVTRFKTITNIFKQSHILLGSNPIIQPPPSMMHLNSTINTSVVYAAVTAAVLVGGTTYACLKFLRKEKE